MTTVDLAPEQVTALRVARYLAEAGMPFFRARPALDGRGEWDPRGGTDRCGYWLPKSWQQTAPNVRMVDRWQPGEALCALQGIVTDALDVDPRNGGDESRRKLEALDAWPTSYGTQATASGGTHDLITPLGVGSRDNLLPGLDVKGGRPDGSGRGFIFVAPTVKLSKVTGEIAAYRWTVEPNLDGLGDGDDSGAELARLILAGGASPNGDHPDGEHDPFDWKRALTPGAVPGGEQNPTLFAAACSLRHWGVSNEAATEFLRRVVAAFVNTRPDDPWTPEHADEVWKRVVSRYAPGEKIPVVPALVEAPTGPLAPVSFLSDVERERVAWLWPGRIPLGKLTIIEGDPERAKSTVTLDLAARTSTGSPMPDGHEPGSPAGVLLVCAEDDVADTIIPRLLAHGADLGKIATLKLQRDEAGRLIPLSIPEDLPRLEAAIKRCGARLVVIDPITAYLSEEINSHNDPSVRRALTPLGDIAQRLGAAIVLVRHLNKDKSQKNALYRGGGSIAFAGSARSVLVVDRHPEDPKLIVLARVKNNLAVYVPSLGYRIASDLFHESPRIDWQGVVPIDADTLLRGPDGRLDAPARDEAEDVLRELLADGPMAAKQVRKLAREAGVTESTLKRAKDRLEVRSTRQTDPDTGQTTGWTWRLPGLDEPEDQPRGLTTHFDPLGPSGPQETPEGQGLVGDPLADPLDDHPPAARPFDPRYDPPHEAPGAL